LKFILKFVQAAAMDKSFFKTGMVSVPDFSEQAKLPRTVSGTSFFLASFTVFPN
jgi:hypothetical protein